MRRRTVRSGLRLLTLAVGLLLLGMLGAQQFDALSVVAGDGADGFVRLSFFWSVILGTAALAIAGFGLLQRSLPGENVRLLPTLVFLALLLAAFINLVYRSVAAPSREKPLRPGETLII